jgi:hypothetical protein
VEHLPEFVEFFRAYEPIDGAVEYDVETFADITLLEQSLSFVERSECYSLGKHRHTLQVVRLREDLCFLMVRITQLTRRKSTNSVSSSFDRKAKSVFIISMTRMSNSLFLKAGAIFAFILFFFVGLIQYSVAVLGFEDDQVNMPGDS